jgi:hypothetical protein
MTLLFVILIFWIVSKIISREEKKIGRPLDIESFLD